MQLFNDIERALDRDIKEGWCSVDKAQTLAAMIIALKPKCVVEVGVWAGRSLIPMAMALRHNGFGRVIGIDPWSREASIEGLTGDNLKWWGTVAPHEWIFQEFEKALKRFDLNNWVEIQRVKSDDAMITGSVGLLHIDGSHTTQAVKDVRHFIPMVEEGGLIIMDDIGWFEHGVANPANTVDNAVHLLVGEFNCQQLGTLDTGGIFRKCWNR